MRILLVVYDNDSYIHWFPQGLAYIAAVLRRDGNEVIVYNQDVHHFPEEHLTSYLDENRFDMVGVNFIGGYYQYFKILSIARSINRSKHRPYFVLGGHGPSPEPEYFLKLTQADAIVIGEGELTILDLIARLRLHEPLPSVTGIAYRENDTVSITPRRELIKDVDSIPFPAYDLFPVYYYRLLRLPHCVNGDFVMPVLSGRGCVFKCNFCYRLDPGFRARSAESIIEEIKFLKKEYGITYISFSDELLMSSISRVVSLCEDFIRHDLHIKWSCNGRLNFAKPKVLELMKRAGCVFINYGIEAFDDETLKKMNKVLTTKQITAGIEATLSVGISPGFNIIFGNIDENRKTLQQGVDFLLKYDDHSQLRTIRPVTPYPGSPLYYLALKRGLLRDVADFYEHKHTNSDLLSVNFTQLSDEEFYEALAKANTALVDNYFNYKHDQMRAEISSLYNKRDKSFRGFRQT
jgi:anaerobic magnesium-protoporphyrin IX monomethyl ester cyclase